jgi:class 3 adenylate cyclase
LTVERGGVRFDVRVPRVPGYLMPSLPWWATLPFIVVSVATAVLLLVRGAHWHLARRYFVASLLVALCSTPYFSKATAPRLDQIRLILILPLALGLSLWCLNESFPGLRLWGRGQRAVAVGLALVQSASFAAVYWLPGAGMAMGVGGIAVIGFVVADLVALTRVYRRADALQRRQLKWAVYGFYVGLSAFGLVTAVLSLGVVREWVGALFAVGMIALVAIPLGVLIAIAFYDFLDIDQLFSATLSYSVLAFVGMAFVLAVMPTAALAVSDALGLLPAHGQILVALGLAAVAVPAQRFVRQGIDSLIFPQRVALEQGFAELLTELSSCADMQQLAHLVGQGLDRLLQPEAAAVYTRSENAITPLMVRGRIAPPVFAAHSTLVAALRERAGPLVADRWTTRRSTSLTPFERGTLETLDVAVVVPFHRGGDVVAFACLGPKRSGDIYSPTDLAWLGAVGGKVADRLLALDATTVAAQSRSMQEALRRYVPGAVADRLAGTGVPAGEREVSVLFADIRGYTTYAEGRRNDEIFITTNRFTEAMSRVVRAHGGTVVEFSGDGLMAVFGAPEPLARKERAAVEAGRELLDAIGSLPVEGTNALSVGVGIASGPAYVGDVHAVDHHIWTVIGNTPNLAARLQALTRELDAAMAIDATTRERAGYVSADFVLRPRLTIRGRTEPADVYVLPLTPAATDD